MERTGEARPVSLAIWALIQGEEEAQEELVIEDMGQEEAEEG